jgi:PBP1b-binding outer membrane lipoprotein LpoB
MKKIYSLTSAIVVVATLTGCSSKPTPAGEKGAQQAQQTVQECRQDGQLAPQWTCMPQSTKDMIVGLGSAPKSNLGMNFTRTQAMAAARNDLAFQIEAKVKASVESFARSTGVKDNESVDKVATQVSKQLAQADLQGTRQINFWQNPVTGTVYVLVGAPVDAVNAAVKKNIKDKSSYKNNDALWQQFQSQQALKQLDKDFPTQ